MTMSLSEYELGFRPNRLNLTTWCRKVYCQHIKKSGGPAAPERGRQPAAESHGFLSQGLPVGRRRRAGAGRRGSPPLDGDVPRVPERRTRLAEVIDQLGEGQPGGRP